MSFPDVTEAEIIALCPGFAEVAKPIRDQVGREALYARYLDRQTADAEALKRDEAAEIPDGFDYAALSGLSTELTGQAANGIARGASPRRRSWKG